MSQAKVLQEKAEMFERRAESAADPISKQHYKEMAAHYRSLAVERLPLSTSTSGATNRRTDHWSKPVWVASGPRRLLRCHVRSPLCSPCPIRHNVSPQDQDRGAQGWISLKPMASGYAAN